MTNLLLGFLILNRDVLFLYHESLLFFQILGFQLKVFDYDLSVIHFKYLLYQ